MKCKYCKKEIEEQLKYVAYYVNNKPVYWKMCDDCVRKKFVEYMKSLKKEQEDGFKNDSE